MEIELFKLERAPSLEIIMTRTLMFGNLNCLLIFGFRNSTVRKKHLLVALQIKDNFSLSQGHVGYFFLNKKGGRKKNFVYHLGPSRAVDT
jgi:hypothetical protein